ncbi:MAG: hypothetical protein V5A46_10910 [Haloferacaceae archaeon]
MSDILSIWRQHSEKILLFVYFFVIVGVSVPLSRMFGQAWRTANLSRGLLYVRTYVGASLEEVTVLFFGVFVGLLALMTVDTKKRIQAILLWIGTGAGLIGLSGLGLFLPNVSFTQSIAWLAGGIAVGALAGGRRELLNLRTATALEFRRASTAVYYLLVALFVVAFLEYHVQYTPILARQSGMLTIHPTLIEDGFSVEFVTANLSQHLLLGGVFVVTLRQFIQYDAERVFVVVGPGGSGKTMFLAGLYKAARDMMENEEALFGTPMQASSDLGQLMSELDTGGVGWPVASTDADEAKDLSFRFVQGTVFPRNIAVYAVDYAGQLLPSVPQALIGEPDDPTLSQLASRIEQSDVLIMLLDCEAFVNDDNMDIYPYYDIIEHGRQSGTEFLFVATKADYLAREFREEKGLEAENHPDEFRRFLNAELRRSEQIPAILQETSTDEIHPVYYMTRENESGELVPMRDRGQYMTQGFEELLDVLGR